MDARMTRRQVLAASALAASEVLLQLPGRVAPTHGATQPYVRRDVANLKPNDPIFLSYRKAVKAMQDLDKTNPTDQRSWANQAAIHGRPEGRDQARPWIATCEHSSSARLTPYFWPWHRMYLYWFEQIVREMSGDHSWALPYWNYTSSTRGARQLPEAFRDPSNATNPLYVPSPFRSGDLNEALTELSEDTVSTIDPNTGDDVFQEADFLTASVGLEAGLHGNVHVAVGGDDRKDPQGRPVGWMSRVPTSARDPIFYLHHANLDRMWGRWLKAGQGRHSPIADPHWAGQEFWFIDVAGKPVKMTSCAVLGATRQLNYIYEGEPDVSESCATLATAATVAQTPVPVFEARLALPPQGIVLASARVSVPLNLADVRSQVTKALATPAERVLLELNGVEADRPPGVLWQIYVGPAGIALNTKSPYYVGLLSLFSAGIRGELPGEFKPARFTYRVDRALQSAFKTAGADVRATFVPTSGLVRNGEPIPPKVASPIHIGGLRLLVTRTH